METWGACKRSTSGNVRFGSKRIALHHHCCAHTFNLPCTGTTINDVAADFDGQKHRPGDIGGNSRQLRKSISVKLRELTNLSLATPAAATEIGLARLHEADITKTVSTVIGIVSALFPEACY